MSSRHPTSPPRNMNITCSGNQQSPQIYPLKYTGTRVWHPSCSWPQKAPRCVYGPHLLTGAGNTHTEWRDKRNSLLMNQTTGKQPPHTHRVELTGERKVILPPWAKLSILSTLTTSTQELTHSNHTIAHHTTQTNSQKENWTYTIISAYHTND